MRTGEAATSSAGGRGPGWAATAGARRGAGAAATRPSLRAASTAGRPPPRSWSPTHRSHPLTAVGAGRVENGQPIAVRGVQVGGDALGDGDLGQPVDLGHGHGGKRCGAGGAGDHPVRGRRVVEQQWRPSKQMPRTRRGHHHIDLARARLIHGDRTGALTELQQAKLIAPQKARHHPMVRSGRPPLC